MCCGSRFSKESKNAPLWYSHVHQQKREMISYGNDSCSSDFTFLFGQRFLNALSRVK
jgi:hypothetical protein